MVPIQSFGRLSILRVDVKLEQIRVDGGITERTVERELAGP
ncbi:MAG TPA: hypothetical protein VEH77_16645 [Roseiarcus sp.]|nr:hypothetical protein [Roseiarcus sp.]